MNQWQSDFMILVHLFTYFWMTSQATMDLSEQWQAMKNSSEIRLLVLQHKEISLPLEYKNH